MNYETFNALYEDFVIAEEKKKAVAASGKNINFPLSAGSMDDSMLEITNIIRRLLFHYRISDNFRVSRYFNSAVGEAVSALRKIYKMENSEEIDELFYGRMLKDANSLSELKRHSF